MARGCARGCATLVVSGVLITAVAYAGFRWGDEVFPAVGGVWRGESPGEVVEPSPALAQETLDRLEAFRAGNGDKRFALGSAELSSLIRYSLPGMIPVGVHDPSVGFLDGDLLLSARVAVASFPDVTALDEILELLPDTVEIRMRGALLPFSREYAALHVERVEASRIPLPGRMVPGILTALGRSDREGLPSDAMVIPLPRGVQSAFVEQDQLILVSEG